MKEIVTLNRKEQRRLVVLNQVETGKMIGREAIEVLDPSLRQVRRLLAADRKEGAAALARGNRGRVTFSLDNTVFWQYESGCDVGCENVTVLALGRFLSWLRFPD
jgi:hypothetical protein